MRIKLLRRFPDFQQIFPVYGLIIPFIFGWSLYWFSWILPSWSKFLNVGELIAVLSYVFVINFLETLILILLWMIVAFTLPAKWFRDDFVLRASIGSICLFAFLIYISSGSFSLRGLLPVAGIAFLVYIALVALFTRVRLFRVFMEELADRSIIFSYITIPISIVSFVVVLSRNF